MSQKIFHPLKPKDAPAEGASATDNTVAPSAATETDNYKPGLTTGDLCYIAAEHLGLLGPRVASGLYQLRCPWADEHAPYCKQRDGILDNSPVLYKNAFALPGGDLAAQGDGVYSDGGVLCKHEHSAGPHKGVPLNANVFLGYARSCGAPLPDRSRGGWIAPSEAATQPEQVGEFSLTGDALESYAHTAAKSSEGELTSAEFKAATSEPELRIDPPNFIGDRYPDPKGKVIPPLEIKDGAPTVDSLAGRIGAMLDIPKERILRSAETVQGHGASAFSTVEVDKAALAPTPPAPEPAAQPMGFTEFVKQHQPSMAMFRWKEGHWLIMSGLENALTMRESLILAPPRTGRSMLATILFPAWLMLEKGKQNVLVVCESDAAAKARHREILGKFPAIEPFIGLVIGKTVDKQPRLQFRGPYTSLTGQGFDAIIIDPSRGSEPKLAKHYAVLSSRLAPGGFMTTITNREGEGDFAQALINFGGGWGQRLQAHLFPDMIPNDIDRTTDTYFWQYNQGLPSYYGAKDIAAAPSGPPTPFKKFLADCLTDEQAAELQLLFGRMYIKGRQDTEERIYVHVGAGANGKTTLLNAVASVFPVARLDNNIVGDLKLMNRMRVSFAVLECGDNMSAQWASAMANVGAGRIAYELKCREPVTMLSESLSGRNPSAPVFIHVAANELEEFDDHDDGTYRRLRIFEWKKTIPADQRDPNMEAKISRDPDFLIWLAEGLRRYQTTDKARQTIDRLADDIALSDEPSE